MSDFSGQEFGDYIVAERIFFRGAIGLYRARNRVENSPVFLEIVEPTVEQEPELVELFQQRIDKVARFQHPGVATITHIGVTASDQCYAAMEHFPGVSLAEMLSEMAANGERMPAGEALGLIRHIADALAIIHRAGLVHQDLRPESILINEGGAPVFFNLGLPDAITPLLSAGDNPAMVALDYASPEQDQGEPVTPQSNIFSLGILLYEMLAGHRPEVSRSSWDIFGQRREAPRAVPLQDVREGLSAETYQLVKNCLWQEEWNRYESVHSMLEALEQAITAEQELASRTVFSPRRRRWLFAGASTLLFLLLLGPGFFRNLDTLINQSSSASQQTAVPTRATTPMVFSVGVKRSPTPSPAPKINGEVTPTLRPFVAVELLSPPPGSEFVSGDDISFQWYWPMPLESDQVFAVYLLSGDERTLMGTVNKPLANEEYRLQISSEKSSTIGTLLWQVLLEASPSGEVLAGSDRQTITLIPPNTPTMTATASPTATATKEVPTATATATETPTPTPECVRRPPPGWTRYIIRGGDVISNLASLTGTTINRIREVNCLPNNILAIGQSLWLPPIPVTDTPVPSEAPPSGGSGSSGQQPPPQRPTPTPPTPP